VTLFWFGLCLLGVGVLFMGGVLHLLGPDEPERCRACGEFIPPRDGILCQSCRDQITHNVNESLAHQNHGQDQPH
jgi:hypothetical protein